MRNLIDKGKKEVKTDVYDQVTASIVAALEAGVQPWFKTVECGACGRADHTAAAGERDRLSRDQCPDALGHGDGTGIFRPAVADLQTGAGAGGQVRKGEKGSLVVYANSVTRTETDEASGEETARNIPFLKSYTVFNAEQVDGLPAHFYAMAPPALSIWSASRPPIISLPQPARMCGMVAIRLITRKAKIACRCHPLKASRTRSAIMPLWPMS